MDRWYYAIYDASKKPIIVDDWEHCKLLTHGIPGVRFKKFRTKTEATLYIEAQQNKQETSSITDKEDIFVYVDGSFMPGIPYGSWAWVAVHKNKKIDENKGWTSKPAISRNIDGECEATQKALEWAQQKGCAIVVMHDYEGIAKWASGDWKAKSEVAKQYVRTVSPLKEKITFMKVKGHSGNPWNEYVDALARSVFHEKKV